MHLVVGGTGAIGTALCEALVARGDRVIICVRRTSVAPVLVDRVAVIADVDITDAASLLRAVVPFAATLTHVWNLAAPLSVDTAKDPANALAVTVGGMQSLLSVLELHAPNVIVMFSDSIGSFGAGSPRLNATARWLVENPAHDPGSDYGRQKGACRALLRASSLRTRWAVIPGVLHTDAAWGGGTTEYALDAIASARAGRPFVCPVQLDVLLPMIDRRDLICGLLALADASDAALNEPDAGYALAGYSFTANMLFTELSRLFPSFSCTVQESDTAGRFARLWCDSLSAAEATRDLGFTAQFALLDTLSSIVGGDCVGSGPSTVRLAAALLGVFVGDALSMPAHWYYAIDVLRAAHGVIDGYVAPQQEMEASYLGRIMDRTPELRGLINHGQEQFWAVDRRFFYHCSLAAGENTLEASLARLYLRTVVATQRQSVDMTIASREAFFAFMSTPGSHNDAFASSYIRTFISNFARGLPLEQCVDMNELSVPEMDALTVAAVAALVAMAHGDSPFEAALAYCKALRHVSAAMEKYLAVYTDMLVTLANPALGSSPTANLQHVALKAASALAVDLPAMVAAASGGDPVVSCALDVAFPAALVFLHKYAADAAGCLLASANAGGDNVARSSMLGPLLGLAHGKSAFAGPLTTGLHDGAAILAEIAAALRS